LKAAASIETAVSHLADSPVDVVLLDIGLPGAKGQKTVEDIRRTAPRVSIVLMADLRDEDRAIQAMQEGAQDYLIKGEIEPYELMRALLNKRFAVLTINALSTGHPASKMVLLVLAKTSRLSERCA
jgi:DNA-binding NarL/FixJ family response regulator